MPIELHKHGVAALAAFAMMTGAVGCAQEDDAGQVAVRVDALSAGSSVTRMRLTSAPDGASVDLTASGGVYAGSVVVPAGDHTFAVDAFAGDAQIGHGSASANIVANTITALQI